MTARRLWFLVRRLDPFAVGAILLLLAIGIAFIYSAGYRGPGEPVAPFYRRHLLWALLGAAAFLAAVATDGRRVAEQAWWLYAISIALLVWVLVGGVYINGARRWLHLFVMPVQPSEFAKVATVLALARHLSRTPHIREPMTCLLQTAAISGLPFVLIAVEPDLGTAAIIVPVVFAMIFVAGLPLRVLGGVLLVGLLLLPLGWFALTGYQQDRVRVFLDPSRDPLGKGWNAEQSRIAIGSGGPTGKGYLRGTQNVLGFLPSTVAQTDFIFSVVAEERGFAGSLGVLALYTVVAGSALRAAHRARDKFGQLAAAGLGTLLYAHAFVNIGMTAGLLPVTGLPLPLVSYGGSFMLSTMVSLGLIQGVYVRRHSP